MYVRRVDSSALVFHHTDTHIYVLSVGLVLSELSNIAVFLKMIGMVGLKDKFRRKETEKKKCCICSIKPQGGGRDHKKF